MKTGTKRLPIFSTLIILILFSGCTGSVYRKWDKNAFSGYIWESGREVVFEPVITDTARTYKIILGLRHIYGVKYSEIPVSIDIVFPSSVEKKEIYIIPVLDEKGRGLADCTGTLCDIETVVETSYRFSEQGTYRFIVSQVSAHEKLVGMMELGLIIK